MFQFAHPDYLYALLLLPLLGVLFAFSQWRKNKRQAQWGNRTMFLRLVQGQSTFRVVIKFVLQLSALALLIVLLAQPQYGLTSGKPIKKQGIEVIFALRCFTVYVSTRRSTLKVGSKQTLDFDTNRKDAKR